MKQLAIPMKTIEAYSLTHILVVVCIMLAAFFAAFVLNKRKVRATRVVLVSEIILVAFEILKQLLLTYVRGGEYSWSDFPFQLCSTPMYLCAVYLFAKRTRKVIEDYLMVFGTIGAIAAFAIPYSSFYDYLLLTAQSLLWHGILLFFGFYFCIKNWGKHQTRDYAKVCVIYICLAILAIILNAVFYDISLGDSNMFFLGPAHPKVTILELIYEKAGWIVESISMIAATSLGGFIVFKLMGNRLLSGQRQRNY